MKKFIVFSFFCVCAVGCLKTRAELEAEGSGQQMQQQTIAQQRAEAKQKPPPPPDRFDEYDEEMRDLTGRVSTLENSMGQVNNGKQGEKDATAKDKQVLEQRLLAYEDALKRLEQQVAAQADEIARLKAPPPVEVAAVTAKGKTAPYETGEEQFNAKKWKEAIISFQKYRDQNPKGKVFADATYKIGVCFQELGMKDDAKAFLEEVTTKFPNSKEAKKAAFRLKSLK